MTIIGVSEGHYDKPNLDFDDGTRLSVNATNNRALSRAYGFESDDWVGKQVELSIGEIEYNSKMQESILVRPISPPVAKKVPPKSDMSDDIPF